MLMNWTLLQFKAIREAQGAHHPSDCEEPLAQTRTEWGRWGENSPGPQFCGLPGCQRAYWRWDPLEDAADLPSIVWWADATVSSFLDSRRQLEEWQNGSQPEELLNLNIPLLMQNKVPEGFEDGDHIKVDLRPESVSTQITGFRSFIKLRCDTWLDFKLFFGDIGR